MAKKPKKKLYSFTGKEGAFMSEALLKKWMQKHEDHHVVRGHFFGKEIIAKILSKPGCVGIRIYYGIDDDGQKVLILIGTDSKGKSMWPSESAVKGTLKDGGAGADQSKPCPPFC